MEAGKEEVRLIQGVGGTMRGTHILGIQYQITQGHAIFQYQSTCEPDFVLRGERSAQFAVLGAQQSSGRVLVGDCGRMEGSVGVLLLTQERHLRGVWGVVELLRSHLDGMDDGVSHLGTHGG